MARAGGLEVLAAPVVGEGSCGAHVDGRLLALNAPRLAALAAD
jgi:hypothetical protein